MKNIFDQLSWEEFEINSKKEKKPLKKATEFNRLIAHTKNFFLISGYGAFTEGYILIISKNFIPSYGLAKDHEIDEVKFLIKLVKKFIDEKYNKKTMIFEHGMCACVGGLDRAHLHLMSVPKNCKKEDIRNSIDKVLSNRNIGVKYIRFNNYKLENRYDINQIYEKYKNSDKIKIIGSIMKINNIQNLAVEEWPKITLNHINKGGHYVYFDSGEIDSSFLTTYDFQTQFGRQVVFEIQKRLDKKFNSKIKKLEKQNPHMEVWKWQNYKFDKEIVKTINDARKKFFVFSKIFFDEYEKYDFKII